MADSNEQEKLKITAELDTSKLKQQAQQGMNAVVQEEKKVEQQAKQTSKAVDDIGTKGKNVGDALKDAGSKGTQALKEVGKEAEKTAEKISDIDKSVKNLKLGQAIGIASRFAGSDIGRGFGNAVGESLGMSEDDRGLAGSAIQGGLQGAAMGAMVAGPWGAAAGALIGAGTSLLQAGDKLKEAAELNARETELRLGQTIGGWWKIQSREKFDNLIANGSDNELRDRLDYEKQQKEQNELGITLAVDRVEKGRDDYGLPLSTQKKAELEKNITEAIEKRAQAMQNIARIEAEIERRDREADARVARFLADEEAEKKRKEAEANLPVGPEIPPEILAQRNAEEKAQEQFNKELKKNWLKEMGDNVNALQNAAKEKLSSISGMAGMKLTDSLTQIGGGAGYGAQMTGISNYVAKVVSEVKSLNKTAEEIKNKMDSIKNEGVFVGESE